MESSRSLRKISVISNMCCVQVLEIILEYVEPYDMEEYDEQQYHVQQM